MKDMKFKIDGRFIAVQTLLAVAAYALALLAVLYFLNIRDPWGFVGGTFVVAVGLYFYSIYPRDILVDDDGVSFVEKYSRERIRIPFFNIGKVEISHRLYNTMTLTTKSGLQCKLYPRDARKLADLINARRRP